MSVFEHGNPVGDLDQYSMVFLILSDSWVPKEQSDVLAAPVDWPDEEALSVNWPDEEALSVNWPDEEALSVDWPDEEALLVDSIMDALSLGLSLPRAMEIIQAVSDRSDAEMFEHGDRLEATIQRGEETLLHLSDQNECKFAWRHLRRCPFLLPTRWVHNGGPI